MKILQISSAKSFGGGEKHLADLVRGLKERNHEIFLAAPENSPFHTKLSEQTFLNLSLRNALDVKSAWRMASFIKQNKIEIVHAHLARDYPIAALAVKLSGHQAKLVITRHVLFKLNRLHKLTLAKVAKVIAVSAAVENQLLSQKIFPPDKITAIPNGIETKLWTEVNSEKLRQRFREKFGFAEDDLLVGIIGELKELKGQTDFVIAAEIIARKFDKARFIVVGKDHSPDRSLARKIVKMAKVFGLQDRFLWLEWIEETAEMLHAIDVFVSASHSESFGLAIVEAMASACAIVSTETEGAKEILQNGQTAKLVPVENPVKLAEAVNEFLADADLRREFGENAQQFAINNFTLQRMVDETEKVYQEMLNKL